MRFVRSIAVEQRGPLFRWDAQSCFHGNLNDLCIMFQTQRIIPSEFLFQLHQRGLLLSLSHLSSKKNHVTDRHLVKISWHISNLLKSFLCNLIQNRSTDVESTNGIISVGCKERTTSGWFRSPLLCASLSCTCNVFWLLLTPFCLFSLMCLKS